MYVPRLAGLVSYCDELNPPVAYIRCERCLSKLHRLTRLDLLPHDLYDTSISLSHDHPPMKFFTITSIASALLAAVAPAAAAPLQKRDVWAPKVLYPHAGTVWYKGQVSNPSQPTDAALMRAQTHNVTWDTSNAPKQITNNEFFITLGSGISPNPNAEQYPGTSKLLGGRGVSDIRQLFLPAALIRAPATPRSPCPGFSWATTRLCCTVTQATFRYVLGSLSFRMAAHLFVAHLRDPRWSRVLNMQLVIMNVQYDDGLCVELRWTLENRCDLCYDTSQNKLVLCCEHHHW
jgi:hypothetical protein